MNDRRIYATQQVGSLIRVLLGAACAVFITTAVPVALCAAVVSAGSQGGNVVYPPSQYVQNVRGIELSLSKNIDITPKGRKGVRPDAASGDNLLYVAFQDTSSPKRSFAIMALNEKFDITWTGEIPGGTGAATDLRLANGSTNEMWCAFETTFSHKPWGNMLNLTRFNIAADRPTSFKIQSDIARGNLLIAPRFIPEPGDELTDDPNPFYHQGKYYVLTRRFKSATLIVRTFSRDFKLLSQHKLDLSKAVGNQVMGISSLVMLDKGPFLVAGVSNGPRMLPGRDGNIVGFPLNNDLTGLRGKHVVLTATPAYEDYVSGALVRDGKLYIVHIVEVRGKSPTTYQGYLRVYDATRGFAPMAAVALNQGYGGALKDNHLSLAFFRGKICVTHYTPDARLKLLVYEERETLVPSGQIWTDFRVLDQPPDTAGKESLAEKKDMIKDFDKNRDGLVSKQEFPGPSEVFDSKDLNGDGIITREEASPVRQGPAPRKERKRSMRDFIVDFDLNGDKKVSRSEFPGPDKIFTRMDRNMDGMVTTSEIPDGR